MRLCFHPGWGSVPRGAGGGVDVSLTKAGMVEKLHEELGLNGREAKELVEAFFEEMRAALERGDSVNRFPSHWCEVV